MAKYVIDYDQCAYSPNLAGNWHLKKSTRLMSNKNNMAILSCQCQDDHHAHPGHVQTRSSGQHPPKLAEWIAKVMIMPDCHTNDDLFPVDEHIEERIPEEFQSPEFQGDSADITMDDGEAYVGKGLVERNEALKSEFGDNVFRYVRTLHNGMGHPSQAVLVRTLQNANAREEIIKCAGRYERATCFAKRPPPAAPKSASNPAYHFNDRLQMDVFYMETKEGNTRGKVPILHVVDTATRFGTARILAHEQTEDVMKALVRCWLKPYGNPKMIQCDEARCFCADAMVTMLGNRNIELQVAPGEAHNRLGIIERRHVVFRTACENYLDNENLEKTRDNIKEAI